LNLATAVDADDLADYLTIAEANNLRVLDGLFNNVTGHNHGGAHQGGALAASAIPDGSITSAKIQDGTITMADLAANAISQVASAALTTNFSTSSTSLVDVTGATVTLTTQGGILLVFFSGPAHVSASAASFLLDIDGGGPILAVVRSTVSDMPLGFVYNAGARAAGPHTIKLRAAMAAAGTLSMNFGGVANGSLVVVELKR
jgi:hypothetical protein